MGLKIKFYLSQALKSAKRYIYLIVGIGLTVSLIIGLFTYINSITMYNFQSSFSNMHDIEVQPYNRITNKSNILDNFGQNETEILEKLGEIDWNAEEIAKYAHVRLDEVSFDQNQTFPLNIYYYNPEFFQNARFQSYYHLLEGRMPLKDNEYLIDASVAQSLNLTIEFHDNKELFILNGSSGVVPCEFPNFSIVGIYLPKRHQIVFTQSVEFYSPQIYTLEFNASNLSNATYLHSPFFGIIEESRGEFNSQNLHPINHFINNLSKDFNVNMTMRLRFDYGLCIQIDRESINPFRVDSTIGQMYSEEDKFDHMAREIYSISTYNRMSRQMSDFSQDFLISKLSFIGLVLPLIGSTIGLGNFVILTNFKNRFEEFTTYRMKGYPKSMLILQIIFESLISGIFGFIIGAFFAVFVFLLLQPVLNPLYLTAQDSPNIVPMVFSLSNYLIGLGLALVISLFGNITTIIKILKSKIREMKENMQKLELDFGYDENIFEEGKEFKKGGKMENYLSHTDLVEKSIPKLSYYLIFPAMLPLVIIGIRYLGYSPSASDSLVLLATNISKGMKFLLVFVSLSPILITYGLLRFSIQESPLRFAKICKFLSKPFVKAYDFLAGLEMLRRKPYVLIMFILGLFSTSLMFGNLNRSSLIREHKFYNNLDSVSDINYAVNCSENNQLGFDVPLSEIQNFKDDLQSITTETGESIVTDSNFITINNLYSRPSWNYGDSHLNLDDTGFICGTDLSNYISNINTDIKDLYPDLQTKIQKLIDFNQINPQSTGILTNSEYLQRFDRKVGDQIEIYYSLNSSVSDRDYDNFQVRQVTIVDTVEYFPGIPDGTVRQSNEYTYDIFSVNGVKNRRSVDVVVMDFYDLAANFTTIQTQGLVHHITCNDSVSFDTNDFSEDILELDFFSYDGTRSYINVYDHSWKIAKFNEFDLQYMPQVNILYLNLLIIGVLIAFAVITTIIGIEKKNIHFEGLLLSRGFGKKALFSMIFSQIFTIFTLSVTIGTFSGLLTGWTWVQAYLGTQSHPIWSGFNAAQIIRFPVYANPIEFFFSILLNFGLTVLFYTIFFLIQERKSISRLLIKF